MEKCLRIDSTLVVKHDESTNGSYLGFYVTCVGGSRPSPASKTPTLSRLLTGLL